MYNFSIIIPHKNTPHLLQRCLDSIPRRDDLQIIVVDDNSDPKNVNFDQFPGLNDPNVTLIFTKENKGAGYARNIGIQNAGGKWFLFADSDDFYNYCINTILDDYTDSGKDIINFKFLAIDCDLYISRDRCARFNKYIDNYVSPNEKAEVSLRYRHSSVLSKMYKAELIKNNNITFDEVSIGNDITFAYLAGFHANSIGVDCRALYCTTVRQGSIRHKKKNKEMKLDEMYVNSKRYKFYRDNKIKVSPNILRVNTMIISYFIDRDFFSNSMEILKNLKFSKSDILKMCLYCIFIYTPPQLIGKINSRMKKIIKKRATD